MVGGGGGTGTGTGSSRQTVVVLFLFQTLWYVVKLDLQTNDSFVKFYTTDKAIPSSSICMEVSIKRLLKLN